MDSIWDSLQEDEKKVVKNYKNKKSPQVIFQVEEKDKKTKKKTGTQSANLPGVAVKKASKVKGVKAEPANVILDLDATDTAISTEIVSSVTPTLLSHSDMALKLSKDLIGCNDDSLGVRKSSLEKINQNLFVLHSMTPRDYSEILQDVSKPIFRCFGDTSEKCRALSFQITKQFFERASDIQPVLPYFMPSLMQRLPTGLGYDDDLKVFVFDIESHEAFRRGKAVDRQDKSSRSAMKKENNSERIKSTHTQAAEKREEPSEDIRYQACLCLGTILRQVTDGNCPASHIQPYFHEIIIYLQCQLRDPFPDLKMEGMFCLLILSQLPEMVLGMKYFAVALCRGILPVLRHRHARVRVLAVQTLRGCLCVPDEAKRKASGSDAIQDLVGFHEENVLQVQAFYSHVTQINYIAELVVDSVVAVREALVDFLLVCLTEIGDRYDHQTRLIPYLLDLLTDVSPAVSGKAWSCLQLCGQMYEEEHPEDIIEKRQYGIDGDTNIRLDKPLPAPFTGRPRIGVRLYVRGNTKRFLFALVNELTNWVSKTRLKSAHLLKAIVVLCEEHLTMEVHSLLPSFIKALYFAKQDHDKELYHLLLEVYELFGRYTAPEIYIHYIVPRLKGDVDVVQYGADTQMRTIIIEFLSALLSGTKPTLVATHFIELVDVLTDTFVVDEDSSVELRLGALNVIVTLLTALKGKGMKVLESQFLMTGRLTSLKHAVSKVFRLCCVHVSEPSLNNLACEGLSLLSMLDEVAIGTPDESPEYAAHMLQLLFNREAPLLIRRIIQDDYREWQEITIDREIEWNVTATENVLLRRLLECPYKTYRLENGTVALFGDAMCAGDFMKFCCSMVDLSNASPPSSQVEFLRFFSDLLVLLLGTPALALPVGKGASPGVFDALGGNRGICPAVMLSIDASHLPLVMTSFVADSRWSSCLSSQQQRLKFVESVVLPTTVRSVEYLRAQAASVDLPLSSLAMIFDVTFNSIVQSCIAHADYPIALRLSVLTIIQQFTDILSCLSPSLIHSASNEDTHPKLLPFSRQTVSLDSDTVAVLTAVINSIPVLLELVGKVGNDEVRRKAIGVLYSMVPFVGTIECKYTYERFCAELLRLCTMYVVGGEKDESDVLELIDQIEVAALSGNSVNNHVFSTGSAPKAMVTTVRIEEMDHLHDVQNLLQYVCVLDPVVLEKSVRQSMSELCPEPQHMKDLVNRDYGEEVWEILSGLMNHCDVLQNLSTFTKNAV